MSPFPTARSFLGIAKETTKGTPVAPTDYIAVRSFGPLDNINYLDDRGNRGSMVETYGLVQGVKHSEYEVGGDAFADTLGYFLAALLADVGFTVGPPNIHTFSIKNSTDGQSIAFTLTDFEAAIGARAYPGQQFEELALTFNADGLLEYTARSKGFPSAAASTPTPSFSALEPFPDWRCATNIGGSANTIMQQGSLSIRRPVAPIHTMQNSPNPKSVWQGVGSVSGKLLFIAENTAELDRYLNDTEAVLDLSFDRGAGGTAEQIKFTMSKCAYRVAKPVRGKDYSEIDVDFYANANTTDAGASGGYSPLKATLKNAKATGTYQ